MEKPSDPAKKNLNLRISRALIIGCAIFVIAILSAFDGFLAYAYQYRDKTYRGTMIGQTNVSGKTLPELKSVIDQYRASIEKNGMQISSPKKAYRLLTSIASTDASAATDLVTFGSDGLAEKIFNLGKNNGVWKNLKIILDLLVAPRSFSLKLEYDKEKITAVLESFFQNEETPAQNSNLKITPDGALTEIKEKPGQIFPWDKINDEIKNRLSGLSSEPVKISLEKIQPDISHQDAQTMESSVLQIFNRLPLTIKNGDKSWEITKEIFMAGLELERDGKKIKLSLNDDAFDEFFKKISKDIEVLPLESKFRMENGRVAEFQQSQPGLKIDQEQSRKNIIELLNNPQTQEASLVTQEIAPIFTENSANELGIKELVAEGRTNFAGSPQNRRTNIRVAAEKLNGIIIKPSETFSVITAVGPVDAKNGYLPELVIKGDRTLPEYGGGLCQVGTTFFRLILNAGLPVLERRNHSYRVSYYEPPVGMDATIYEPKPDLRFINDYAAPLLLQTRIEGNDLVFEFYGAKDGRSAQTTEPRVYNVVKPAPKKIIETDTLPPGQTKCIEKAHKGSDAEFVYTVTYPNGETKKQTFASHYKPWQEVCLIGKAPDKNTDTNQN